MAHPARWLALFLLAGSLLVPSVPALTLPPPPPPPPADAPAWMFEPTVVVDVDLVIPQSSMDQIPTYMEAERPYVPATFTLTHRRDGEVLRTFGPWAVTLKVKGMYGSFRNLPAGEKAGLKIKFPSGRRPDGLKKFTLNNMVQDGSMVREVLAYRVFRSMGVAAPRTGYARVTINGVPFGTYLNVETMDDVALPRWHASTGHLYEGSYGSWWGNVADPFSGHYEVDEGDEKNRADLRALIKAARGPAKGWFARMHKVADLEQMTRMWACEWFTGHWDGYSQFITNNYYLHSDRSGRFTMMPWGTDQAFTWADRLNDSPDHFIFNNCLRDPIGKALYFDALHAVADQWLAFGLEDLADQALLSVAGESAGADDVKGFIRARLDEHLAWAATLPAAPSGFSARLEGNRRNRRVALSWQKPVPTDGAPEVLGYAVEYRREALPQPGIWTRLGDADFDDDATRITVTLPKLKSGTYTVRVRAVGHVGDSLPASRTVVVP